MNNKLGPALLIGSASVLNVLAGVVLKESAASARLFTLALGLSVAGLIGIGQFVLWNRAHARYPLSVTYPFTGLTFPIALAVSALYNEPVRLEHVLATALVAIGVIIVHRSQDADEPAKL